MGWALLNSSGQGVVIVWALILQGGPKKSLAITQGDASALGYNLTLLCRGVIFLWDSDPLEVQGSGPWLPLRLQPWSRTG